MNGGRDTTTTELPTDKPLVLVTVGSDHHRFDRLIRWVDSWAARRLDDVDCLVQHGPADPPRHARGVDFLPHQELMRLMGAATGVVVQAGPMSIVESRRQGRLPLAVPRLPQLDEVVDDHQVIFARRWAEDGKLILAEDEASVHRSLDDILAHPASGRVEQDPDHDNKIAGAVDRVGQIATELIGDPTRPRPNVLMIGGAGRSGSTLLERCLAQVPGVTGVGEAVHLWERGLSENQLCGCGEAFGACSTWAQVGQSAFGGWDRLDAEEAFTDRRLVVRARHIPGIVLGGLRPEWRLRRARLLRRLNRLYAAVQDLEGSELIVDSSKHPAYAYLLRSASVDLRCVLVVRDPRGVAHSWAKTARRPEITDGDRNMPQYSSTKVVVDWVSYRLLLQVLRTLGVPLMTVRYEDFVSSPREVVGAVLRFSGLDPTTADLTHLGPDAVTLGLHHTVAGNPMRFRTGEVAIRADEAWRTELPPGPRAWVSLLTAPFRWWDSRREPPSTARTGISGQASRLQDRSTSPSPHVRVGEGSAPHGAVRESS